MPNKACKIAPKLQKYLLLLCLSQSHKASFPLQAPIFSMLYVSPPCITPISYIIDIQSNGYYCKFVISFLIYASIRSMNLSLSSRLQFAKNISTSKARFFSPVMRYVGSILYFSYNINIFSR